MPTAYGKVALTGELDKMTTALEGGRNDALNTAAFKIGQLVVDGHIDYDEAYREFRKAVEPWIGKPGKDGRAFTWPEFEATAHSALNGGQAKPRANVPSPNGSSRPASSDFLDGLPRETPASDAQASAFWSARPILTHVHRFARARLASPWAVLGVVLTRVACTIEPHVMLPAQTGTYASLNTYVALVGPSGAGKDAAIGAAADAVDVGDLIGIGVGSGQGIAHQFAAYRKPKGGEPGGVELHTSRVLLEATEVDTLAGLQRQQGSATLLAELRKAWNGPALGFAYVDREKRLSVPAHRYRLGLIVGVQPERADVLLNDAARASGTPQRFLWLPATDPDAPDATPAEPEPRRFEAPYRPHDPGFPVIALPRSQRVVLPVCDQATETIRQARLASVRGEGDALDGHALLCRLKVAAVLSLLDAVDGRRHGGVTDEDWELAGAVAAVSAATRQGVVNTLEALTARSNERRGHDDGAREVARIERTAELKEGNVQRVARLLRAKLEAAAGEQVSHSDLRNSLHKRERVYFDAAIEALHDAGQVEVDPSGRGTRYRLAGSGGA